MPLDLVTVPCLADNFAFLLHDPATGATALVDAPEAAPVQAALAARRWRLGLILLTHHHDDHVQAVPDLRAGGVPVWGAAADAHRLPPLDRALHPGDAVAVGAEEGRVIDVPGHTVGHRRAGPYGRPHRLSLSRQRAGLHRRQPDGGGLRAAFRRHGGADVGQPVAAGSPAGCDTGLFGA